MTLIVSKVNDKYEWRPLNFTEDQIHAVEQDGDILWTKFTEEHASIANLKRSTKQEFEIMRFNEGYEDDVNTVFMVVGDSISLNMPV